MSYETVFQFWAERIMTRLEAWRELPEEVRPTAPAYTREERDQAARSFLFYIISSQLLCTSQNKGDPVVLACLRDLSQVGSFDWATLGLAHLYHGLDVWTRGSGERVFDTTIAPARRRVPHAPPRHMCLLEGLTREDLEERKTHKTAAHYRAEAAAEAGGAAAPAGPVGVVLGDVPFPPDMEVVLDPGLAASRTGCSSGLWRCGLTSNASIRAVRAVTLPLSPGGFLVIWPTVITLTPVARIPSTGGAFLMTGSYLMEVVELHTRSRLLLRGYWADRYFLGERVFDTTIAPARRRVPHAPPRHMCLLEGLTREDLEARLPEVLEYIQERKTHKTAAHYRAVEAGGVAAPVGPAGVVLDDVPFPPGMEVVLDPGLGFGSSILLIFGRLLLRCSWTLSTLHIHIHIL
ncbi:hypothetical protein JCGZ_12936 [Jatropha curcas]|uniref:Aminotransferase-like plant mobile domain-containing protein n=1 Tax=Jatropha curcas TaxID=180498 RepID=A0A067LGH5_JATCU|nr:hypothetical protein JCGZ_12936 [Jatropha curcas]